MTTKEVFVVTGVVYRDYHILAETEDEAYSIWSSADSWNSIPSDEDYSGTTEFEWNDALSCSVQCEYVIGDFMDCMEVCKEATTITEVR